MLVSVDVDLDNTCVESVWVEDSAADGNVHVVMLITVSAPTSGTRPGTHWSAAVMTVSSSDVNPRLALYEARCQRPSDQLSSSLLQGNIVGTDDAFSRLQTKADLETKI